MTPDRARLLLVEHDPSRAEAVRTAFDREGKPVRLEIAGSIAEARRALGRGLPDLILCEWSLPDGQAPELLRDPRVSTRVPLLILSEEGNERAEVEAVQAGALDYVVRSAQTLPDLPHVVDRALREWQSRGEVERAAQALRELEWRYALLAENFADVIWTADLGLRMTYVSPSVERMHGWTVEEWMGLRPDDYLTAESLAAARLALGEALARHARGDAEVPVTLELEHLRKDGSRFWTEVSARLLLDAHRAPTGVVGVTRDITERKQAEAQRQRLEAQLAQSQKMEALGTLAGGIAHDFNNVLTALIGYTELARSALPPDSPARDDLAKALEASARAADLVRQILSFSRPHRPDAATVNAAPIVKETMKLLRASLPSTIEIRTELRTAAAVRADVTQIHQILMNLCTNAGLAMRESGGVLEVRLDDAPLDADTAAGLGMSVGPALCLTVRDTGHGIAPEVLPRVFEPFFTTREDGKGTGLGLSVVHAIARAQGGAVSVESEPGHGATFRVYLPVSPLAAPAPPSDAVAIRRGSERILVVDDEPALVELTRKRLEQLGYAVVALTDGREALERFEADPAGFDLVLTDVTMPRLTGDELARRVLARRPGMPVILWTGYSERLSEEQARAIGVREMLPKPLTLAELAGALRRQLDAGPGRPAPA